MDHTRFPDESRKEQSQFSDVGADIEDAHSFLKIGEIESPLFLFYSGRRGRRRGCPKTRERIPRQMKLSVDNCTVLSFASCFEPPSAIEAGLSSSGKASCLLRQPGFLLQSSVGFRYSEVMGHEKIALF